MTTKNGEKRAVFIEAGAILAERPSGIGHVTLHMIRGLLAREDFREKYEIRLIAPIAKAHLLKQWNLTGVKVVRVPLLARIWNVWPRIRFAPPIDLFFGKGIYIFTNYKRWPLAFSKSITYIHDVSYELFPQFADQRTLKMLQKNVAHWINASDIVITDSKASGKEISDFYKFDVQKMHEIYCGIDKIFKPQSRKKIAEVKKKYGIEKPYIFFLSNIEPRKNISKIFKALRYLPDDFKNKYALVLVGGMSWNNKNILDEMQQVISEGWTIIKPKTYVPDEELPALLSGAEALVHPALHEGFGIPVVEAMACGTPVIISDIPVLHEVAGEAAMFIDPADETDLANKIKIILTDKTLREKLSSIGKIQAAKYTWSEATNELVQYLKQLDK